MESEAGGRGGGGGWITFPFVIATMAGLSLSAGWIINLITFLQNEFNIQDTDAAKIYNYVNGSVTLFPIIAAVIADSFVGCFSLIWFSSLISLLGVVLLVLTAAISHLRPPSCEKGSNSCAYPSSYQSAVLYLALALGSLGAAGTRFTLASMGADQLDTTKHRGIFFNWYLFTMYMANFVSATVLVYVEENVSWAWGLSIFAMANVVGLVVFLCGSRFYRVATPMSSPFKHLACVVVAATKKRKMNLSPDSEDYHHEQGSSIQAKAPTPFFRFLNRAAMKSLEDSRPDGSIISPWRLCTVQQVEDLKSLIKMLPIWLSGLILSIPIAVQLSFIVIQGKTMDSHLKSHFNIPAATMQVFTLISTCITISLLDRLVFPLWENLAPRPPTPLQRVGIGHVFTLLSMVVSAVVESKRLRVVKSHHLQDQMDAVAPISILWLAPQLAIVGVAEAFHFAGQVAFYYQEFPGSFKNTSTAVVAMSIGGAFYSSNLVIDLVRKATGWLPNNISQGRLDNVYWLCCIMGSLNLVFYLVCASLYKYRKS